MNNSSSSQFAEGSLRNFSVRDAKGNYVAVIEATGLDIATARVPIVAGIIEGGIATPVTLARHEGSVHWPWFSDAFF